MATKTKRTKKRDRGEGLGRVREAAAKSGGDRQWLKLGDGDSAIVRVLKDTWKDVFVHRTPMEGDNGRYFADIPCLDQKEKGVPCPGCRDDLSRRYKFYVNVIARDWEGEDGKQKPKDTLLIWSGGITVAKRLDKIDAKYGLNNYDVEVEREGSKKEDTRYDIDVADDEENELSAGDKKLAAKAHKFDFYTKPPEFDDFYVPFSERKRDDDGEDVGEKSRRRGSAFAKKRGDDDEDDDDDRPARRSSKSGGLGNLRDKKGKSSSSKKKTTKVRRRK